MASIVNTAQSEAWNGYEGGHWAANQGRYDAVNSGFNDRLLAAAMIADGDRVLDVGCGNGQVTRLAARSAGRGRAAGIDLSAPMLDRARATAAEEGIANVTFERGDAQIHAFPAGAFDVALSRFGVMFFADPVAAFANIGRALRPGGRVAFLTLRSIDRGDLGAVLAAMSGALPSPSQGPGSPESLADPDRVRQVLTDAGFADVRPVDVEATQVWGRDVEDAAEFLCGWGPVKSAFDQAGETAAARAREAVRAALPPFERDGAVRLRGTAWLTTAIRP